MSLETNFITRPWLESRIGRWVEDGGAVLTLVGPPGAGKTALAEHLVDQLPDVVYAHACRASDLRTLDPERFVEDLAAALAERVPGYLDGIVEESQVGGTIIGTASADRVLSGVVAGVHLSVTVGAGLAWRTFERLIHRPLEHLATTTDVSDTQFLVVVDALDESLTYATDDTLVHLLQRALGTTAAVYPYLRFIVTTRPDERVLSRIAGEHIRLEDDAPDRDDDVARYVQSRQHELSVPHQQVLSAQIAKAAKGNFLYARYVVDALARQTDWPDEAHDVSLPVGLDEHYCEYIDRELATSDEAWQRVFRPLIGTLAVVQGEGATVDLLANCTKLRRSQVDDGLGKLQQYLQGDRPNGPFRIYHESFRTFLLSGRCHSVYPDEAERDLVEYLTRSAPRFADGRVDWLRAPTYTREHLATHAGARGELEPLVNDAGYLVSADPGNLLRAMSKAATLRSAATDIYQRVAAILRASAPPERAAYLALSARQVGLQVLAEAAAGAVALLPWSVPWAAWRPQSPYLVVARPPSGLWAIACGVDSNGAFVVSSGVDGTLTVWDLMDGSQIGEPFGNHGEPLIRLKLLPTAGVAVAVTATLGGGALTLWDVTNCRLLRTHALTETSTGDDAGVWALATAAVGGAPVVAAVTTGGTLWVGRYEEPAGLIEQLELQTDSICGAVVLSDGDPPLVALSDGDGAVAVRSLVDGSPIGSVYVGLRHPDAAGAAMLGRQVGVLGLGIIQDEGRPVVVAGGHQGEIHFFDPAGKAVRDPILAFEEGLSAFAVGEIDGRDVVIASGHSGAIAAWWSDGTPWGAPMLGHDLEVSDVTVARWRGEDVIASAGAFDGTIRVWPRHDALPEAIQQSPVPERSLGFTVSLTVAQIGGRLTVVSSETDGRVTRYDAGDGTVLGVHEPSSDDCATAMAACSIQGRNVILMRSSMGRLETWDPCQHSRSAVGSSIEPSRLRGVGGLGGTPVAIYDDRDRKLHVLNLESGVLLGPGIETPEGRDTTVAVGRCGSDDYVAAMSWEGDILVWRLADGSPVARHQGIVTALGFATLNDEPVVMWGSRDGLFSARALTSPWAITIAIGSSVSSVAALSGGVVIGTFAGLLRIDIADLSP